MNLASFTVTRNSVRTPQLVDSKTHSDGTGVSYRVLCFFQDLAKKPHAISQTTAILIRALVSLSGKKVHKHRQIVRGINVNDIETRAPCPMGRFDMPSPDGLDILLIHHPRLDGVVGIHSPVAWCERYLPAVAIGARHSGIRQLHAGPAAVAMNFFIHARKNRYIRIIP